MAMIRLQGYRNRMELVLRESAALKEPGTWFFFLRFTISA